MDRNYLEVSLILTDIMVASNPNIRQRSERFMTLWTKTIFFEVTSHQAVDLVLANC